MLLYLALGNNPGYKLGVDDEKVTGSIELNCSASNR